MRSLAWTSMVLLLIGCAPEPPDNEHLEGPIDGLTDEQVLSFVTGDELFESFFTPQQGLGPRFNQASCESCHPGDGAGDPNTIFFRFGRWDNGVFDSLIELGGPQLQDRAILGYEPEKIPDEATVVAGFMAPAVSGLGYLEAVEEQTLLEMADPDDEDGDGISGRVQLIEATAAITKMVDRENIARPKTNRIENRDGYYIGRFGHKGGTTSLLHQTVTALSEDMGLTSSFAPNELTSPNDAGYPSGGALEPGGGSSIEIGAPTLNALVFYMKALREPDRRNEDSPKVLLGEERFGDVGCTSCHKPTLTTGPSAIEALDRVDFHPYTDLLLHNMGEELDDGYTEGTADSDEWRTPPLWGIGLRSDSQGGKLFLLHDGRATSWDEAVEYHGGEASSARTKYFALPDEDRSAIHAFLESL